MPTSRFGAFKIYPRGFLGASLGERIERALKPFEDRLLTQQYRVDLFQMPTPTVEVNSNVEALYVEYVKNGGATAAFEFRERILHSALAAFGTSNFSYWFTEQHRSPATGDLHRRFLDDMLRFIRTGQREMSLENWHSILNLSDLDGNITPLSEYANEFFGISSHGYNRQPRNTDLIEVIQDWCAQPGGIEDMLGCLHVMFGNITN